MALQMTPQGTSGSPFVGIDFGSCATRVSIAHGEGAALLTDSTGESAIAAPLALSPQGGVLAGAAARERQLLFPEETLLSPKSLLCQSGEELAADEALFPHKISDPGAVLQIEIGGRTRSAVELVALYFAELRQRLEILRESPASSAVVSTPVAFSPFDRQSLHLAARMAGFQRVRLIEDPTAAALGWMARGGRGRVVVCCWGGEHFSASIVQADPEIARVIASVGAARVGGGQIDRLIARDLLERVRGALTTDPRHEAHLARYALVTAEKVRRALSQKSKTEVQIPLAGAAKPLKQAYQKEHLVGWSEAVLGHARRLCDLLQQKAERRRGDYDALILAGGLTRMPQMREMLEQVFGAPVAEGIDPEEAVARGAVARGRYLDRAAELPLVLDSLPRGYGLEGPGGAVEAILEAGTAVPASKVETFTTYLDQQTTVGVQLFSQVASDWRPLAQVQLSKATPMKAGQPAIEVTFTADEDGVLSVEAAEMMRGKQLVAELHPLRGLSSAQVRATLESLDVAADEDFPAALRRMVKDRAGFLLRSVRDASRRHAGKMTRDEKQLFAKKIQEMEELIDAGEVAEIREALQELEAIAGPLKSRILDAGLQTFLR
ncbi:MAG: Hsp70 family protein [Candidatus Eisenbacteria bacterium]|nr:Hsp70 family protein [Candidatus Eisenbacteria bacterium]